MQKLNSISKFLALGQRQSAKRTLSKAAGIPDLPLILNPASSRHRAKQVPDTKQRQTSNIPTIKDTAVNDDKILKSKPRTVDLDGFLQAIDSHDRVPAWLKLKDMIQLQPELVQSVYIQDTIKLLMEHKSRDFKKTEVSLLLGYHKQLFPNHDISELEAKFHILTKRYDLLFGIDNKVVRDHGIKLLFKNKDFEALAKIEIDCDLHTFNCLLQGYHDQKMFDKVVQMCEAKDLKVLDRKALNYLILSYHNLGWTNKAFDLFQTIPLVDKYLCASLLKGLKDNEKVSLVFKRMEAENIKLDGFLVQLFIKHHVASNPQLALDAFETFSSVEYPSSIIVHTLLDGLFKSNIDLGLMFLQTCHKKSYIISLPMYRTCLESLANAKRPEIMQIYDILRQEKLITPMYNIVLRFCCNENDLEAFNDVWKDLKGSKSASINFISVGIALEMYLKVRDIGKCKAMFEMMSGIKAKPEASQILKFVEICCDSRRFDMIPFAVELITNHGIDLDLSYQLQRYVKEIDTLLKRISANGEFNAVLDFYKVIFTKVQPTYSVLHTVMLANIENRNLLGLVQAWTRLEKEFTPKPESVQILLQGILELGQKNTCEAAIKIAQKYLSDDNPEIYLQLIKLVCKHGHIESIPAMVVEFDSKFGATRQLWNACTNSLNDKERKQFVINFFSEQYPELMMEDDYD